MNKFIGFLLCCLLTVAAWSCDDDEETGTVVETKVSLGSREFRTLESVTPLQIPVVLSSPALQDVVVTGAVKSESNAKEGVDYLFLSKQLRVPKGQTTAYFEVEIKDYLEYTPDRSFQFELLEAQGAGLSGTDACKVTIVSDEGLPVIGFANTLMTVGEEGGQLELEVEMNKSGKDAVSFRLKVMEDRSTAVKGEHFDMDTDKVYVLEPGETSLKVPVRIMDDILLNEDRHFEVELYGTGNVVLSEVLKSVKVNITDDEETVYAGLDRKKVSAVESAGVVWVPVSLKGNARIPVKVAFEILEGTAREGVDFRFPEKELTFPVGQRKDSVKIELLDNDVFDLDRKLKIGMRVVEGAELEKSDSEMDIVILNDDFDYRQLYEDLMGTWKIKVKGMHAVKDMTATAILSGGLTIAEEDENYLKRFVLVIQGLRNGTPGDVRLEVDYDVNTGKMSIPVAQPMVKGIYYNNPSHPEWDNTDLVFYYFNGSGFVTSDLTPVRLEWDKSYRRCTWNMSQAWIGARLCPSGTTDLSINIIDFAFQVIEMTRNE